ncbi:hypothetical protein, partial [Pseudomonas syringae group genomosp. 7]|uniref:hypothetical protein n=1 Tax=Pseudomonas syringae group genomosp. 7 TaxID=251699 RepID=UPI00376F9E75
PMTCACWAPAPGGGRAPADGGFWGGDEFAGVFFWFRVGFGGWCVVFCGGGGVVGGCCWWLGGVVGWVAGGGGVGGVVVFVVGGLWCAGLGV